MKGRKKFMAVSCNHGNRADPEALKAVLAFAKDFKPDLKVHLGDFVDMTAFRSGAKGTGDECDSHQPSNALCTPMELI